MGFFSGTKEKRGQRSLLGPEQMPTYSDLNSAGQGAFTTARDYYNDLLSNDSQTFNQLSAPEMRRFNEQIIPDLSEQFAGMGGFGNLSSSGFRNAAVNAGTDLSERLGAIRSNLRQQGAAGLTNIGQTGLQQYNENYTRPGEGGFAQNIGDIASSLINPIVSAVGGAGAGRVANWLTKPSDKGKTLPYGNVQRQPANRMV